jgi:cobyrinic acid a,c-diamide synthase
MSLIIAGERSGVGKTTITLALLSFLSEKGYRVQSFKVGPDYIDPMFHCAVTGYSCRNLDPILTSEAYLQDCFFRHCQGVDLALVEGVMGLFDGIKNSAFREQRTDNIIHQNFASTAHIARLLNLPVLLVIDCSRLSGSVAAIAHGYRSFDKRVKLAGVVLNRVGSDRHLQLLKDALESINIPILGILRRQQGITIPDRHLGLVPTAELTNLKTLFAQLANLAENCFDWEQLFPLLKTFPSTSQGGYGNTEPTIPSPVKIAIARDRAFNFYYADNIDILEQFGAQLIPWSPLADRKLPKGTQGLYFGGGFPEIFAGELAENQEARRTVRAAIAAGMPTYAECGGLMYLCRELTDFSGETWQMVGVLPTATVMGKSLTLGYRQATALEDSLLLRAGEKVYGHEFHHSHLTLPPQSPLFHLKGWQKNGPIVSEGWQLPILDRGKQWAGEDRQQGRITSNYARWQSNLHASYLHLHFGGYLALAQRFLNKCVNSKR